MTPGAVGNTAPSTRDRQASVKPSVKTSTSLCSSTDRTAARWAIRSSWRTDRSPNPSGSTMRPERIRQRPVASFPRLIIGSELPIGSTNELLGLRSGVDVSVARRERPVLASSCDVSRHPGGGLLGHEVVQAGAHQVAREVLREAAAHRRDAVGVTDLEAGPNDRVERAGRRPRDRPVPQLVVGDVLIRVVSGHRVPAGCISRASTSANSGLSNRRLRIASGSVSR